MVPVHNEQDNLPSLINRVENALDIDFEMILVNDHSSDKTAEIVKEFTPKFRNIRLIENKRDKGFANALRTGFENARSDVILPLMADLCDDLDTIGEMLKKIEEGFDVVCGARYIKGGRRLGGSKLKGFLSGFVGGSLKFFLHLPTADIANAFKMYRKQVIDSIDIRAQGFEISMEITLKAYFRGFKITEVPTVWKEREKGKSSFSMLKVLPGYLKVYLWAIFKGGKNGG